MRNKFVFINIKSLIMIHIIIIKDKNKRKHRTAKSKPHFFVVEKKLLLVREDLLPTLTAGHTLLLLAADLTCREGLLLLNNGLFFLKKRSPLAYIRVVTKRGG